MPISRPKNTSHAGRASLRRTLQRIRLLATDVDGVLTDGGMYYSEFGDELKKFNTRDGMGIKLLQRAGLVTAIITQEDTKLVARRGDKLAIPEVHQGAWDKLNVLRTMIARHGLTLEEVAYIGDDVNDLATLQAVGFSAAPADSQPSVLKAVDYICRKKGGEGAVREIADLILAARGIDPQTLLAKRESLHEQNESASHGKSPLRATNNDSRITP